MTGQPQQEDGPVTRESVKVRIPQNRIEPATRLRVFQDSALRFGKPGPHFGCAHDIQTVAALFDRFSAGCNSR